MGNGSPALVMFDDPDLPASRANSTADIPDRDLDRSISHLLGTAKVNHGHLDVHAAAAQPARDPVLLAHHLRHAANHAALVSEHLVKLRDAVARRVPAVGQQLENLHQAIPGHRSSEEVPLAALDMSIAHDMSSGIAATAHVGRHLFEAQAAQAAGNKSSVAFNIEHAVHHIAEIAHCLDELDDDLSRKLPAVGRELDVLAAAAAPPPGVIPMMAEPDPGRSLTSAETDYDVMITVRGAPEPA